MSPPGLELQGNCGRRRRRWSENPGSACRGDAKEAQGLQAKALERMRTLRPEEMSPADVLRFFVEAARLERLALGEPDTLQRQEVTGKGRWLSLVVFSALCWPLSTPQARLPIPGGRG
jgi:hypothetical protein